MRREREAVDMRARAAAWEAEKLEALENKVQSNVGVFLCWQSMERILSCCIGGTELCADLSLQRFPSEMTAHHQMDVSLCLRHH